MEAYHNIASLIAPLSIFLFLLMIPCALALIFFCRREGYPPRTQPALYRLLLDAPPENQQIPHNPLVTPYNGGMSGITSRSGVDEETGARQESSDDRPAGYHFLGGDPENTDNTGLGESPASIEMSRLAGVSASYSSNHQGDGAAKDSEISPMPGLHDSDLGLGNGGAYGALPIDYASPSLQGAIDNETRQQRLRDAMNN